MISLEEAWRRQNELQSDGKELLKKFKVDGMLEYLGELHFDGSFLYGLMVKPDIDMHIYVDHPDIRPIADITKHFLLEGATRVHVSNKQDFVPPGPGKPKGIYLGLRFFFKEREWNFDVWIIRREDEIDQENFPAGWHEKLTDEQRDDILWLKHNLKEFGRYPGADNGHFNSADIYRAVMNDGVKTIEELDEWRKTHPYY